MPRSSLQAGEGHAHDGDAVAVVELTVGDGDIGEVGGIQQGAGEGHKGDIHLLTDAVDGTHLILVVSYSKRMVTLPLLPASSLGVTVLPSRV